MWKFEEFINMVRRVSGMLGVAALAFWIIFMMVYMLLQSTEEESDNYPAQPIEPQNIPQGCLSMGEDIFICDEPGKISGDVQ